MKRVVPFFLTWLLAMATAAGQAQKVSNTSDSDLEVFDAETLLKINSSDIDQRRRSWDQQQLLASLQGIVNRERPRLYVFAIGRDGRIDHYWLGKLRQPGQWLAGGRLHELTSLDALVSEYRSMIRGLVVWDERVPATALVAATAAGVDDLLPVR